jgi:uncharacterized coiled-coil protein SlyX
MALKLKLGVTSIGSVDTNIGCLRVFDVQPSKFFKYLSEKKLTLSEESPTDAVHRFLLFICYPGDSVIDDKIPNEVLLRIEDVKELESKYLNDICKLYLLENVHLLLPKKEIENDEIDLASDRLFEIHLEKDESYVELLYRALIEKLKRMSEESNRLKELYENSAFSKAITSELKSVSAMAAELAKYNKVEEHRENISAWRPIKDELLKKNNLFAQELKGSLKGFGFIDYPYSETPIQLSEISGSYKRQIKEIEESERLKQERHEKPFKDLSAKLSEIIERNDKYIDYTLSNNEVQIKMFNSIKESSEASDKHAVENIRLSRLVIVISIVSILLSGIGIYNSSLGTSLDEQTVAQFEGYSKSISDRMNLNIETVNTHQKELIEELRNIKTANGKELESLREQFEVMKKDNQEYLDRIRFLEEKMNEEK